LHLEFGPPSRGGEVLPGGSVKMSLPDVSQVFPQVGCASELVMGLLQGKRQWKTYCSAHWRSRETAHLASLPFISRRSRDSTGLRVEQSRKGLAAGQQRVTLRVNSKDAAAPAAAHHQSMVARIRATRNALGVRLRVAYAEDRSVGI